MRVMGHRRAPGVEDGQDANASAEMLGIGCDGEHGLGGGLEQQVVDDSLVLIGDIGDPSRQGEHHVIVRHRQQLCLALGQPFLSGGGLTFGTVPVTAGVIGDDGVSTLLAALDMPTERRCAAALDGRHHLQLVEADVAGIGTTPCAPWSRKISATSSAGRDTVGGGYAGGCSSLFLSSVFLGFLRFGRASRSSGLSMAEIVPVATWR